MNLCYVMWNNISWKSATLNFDQLSLNLTTVQRRRQTLEPLGSSPVAWYTIVISDN